MTADLVTLLANGCTARPARVEDAPVMITLYHAVSLHVVGEIEDTLEEVLEFLTSPHTDLDLDTRLVFDPQGQLIGLATVEMHIPQDMTIDMYLLPSLWAEDTLITPYLMAWAEARTRDALTLVPAQERITVTAWCHQNDAWYAGELEKLGFTPVRSSYQMWIDFDPAQTLSAPTFPQGVTVRTVTPDEDWRRVYDARREAWHDMWGYFPRTYEEDHADWREYWDKHFAAGYWFIAEKDDQVIAICLCQADFGSESDVSYIASVGTRRAYRQQGLASALLRHGLKEIQAKGKRAATLYVDASSLTGAVRLYERAGMHIKHRYDRLQKELRAGSDQRVQAAGA